MREIKFRGRQTIDRVGTWRYGFFQAIPNAKYASIVGFNEKDNIESWRVDHETVGQFTGLHDKNGVEIYEGDIVLRQFGVGYSSKMYASFADGTQRKQTKTIVWNKIYCGYDFLAPPYDDEWLQDFEVIGNIHNKPELVEVTE